MKLANPLEMLLLSEPRSTARPARSSAVGSRGMRRIGDPPRTAPKAPENTVYIAADSLSRAEEIARDNGLAAWEWRMVVSARDVRWHALGPDARVIEDSRGCEVSAYIRRVCGG